MSFCGTYIFKRNDGPSTKPFVPSSDSMETQSRDICETVSVTEARRFGSFTALPCRRSLAVDVCDDALAQLTQDWNQHTGPSKTLREPGLENDLAGNCVLLALPEAIPERLWHVVYLAGLTFHLDGKYAIGIDHHYADEIRCDGGSGVPRCLPQSRRTFRGASDFHCRRAGCTRNDGVRTPAPGYQGDV